MPSNPCWADRAAAEYANDPIEERLEAIYEQADQMTSWTVQDVYQWLQPHQKEDFDHLLELAAECYLERKRDQT